MADRGGGRHGTCMVLEIVDIFLYNYTRIARGRIQLENASSARSGRCTFLLGERERERGRR